MLRAGAPFQFEGGPSGPGGDGGAAGSGGGPSAEAPRASNG